MKKKDNDSSPVTCGPVCQRYCESGLRVDANGCPYCQCIDPCEAGYQFEIFIVSLFYGSYQLCARLFWFR